MARVLRLRGLPFSATDDDITKFFSGFKLEDVRICVRQGKPTGEAWVRFDSDKACTDALAQRDKQVLGKRYIELFRAKEQDLEGTLPEVSLGVKGNVLRMRGLPFAACISDIIDFFKGVPALDKEQIFFAYDGSGRPSGEAYICFTSTEGCNAAMKLHKNKMGSRYIELFVSSSADLQRAARQRKLRVGKGEGGGARVVVQPNAVETKAAKPVKAGVGKDTVTGEAVPHYKPIVVKQLTKTFASIAASPAAGSSPAAEQGEASGDAAQAGEALAAQMGDAGLDDAHEASLFTHPDGAVSPGSGASGGRGRGRGRGGRGSSKGPSNHHSMQQQHSVQQHADGQMWQTWGMPPFGMGVEMYNMWSNNQMLPKLGPHEQMQAGFQNNMWQPSYQHMQNGAYAGMEGIFPAQVDPRQYHHGH